MPTVDLGLRSRQGSDLVQVQTESQGRVGLSADERLTLEVGLRFSLDRLLYVPAEVGWSRTHAQQRMQRQERERVVASLHGRWLDLCAQASVPPGLAPAESVRWQALGVELDIFTDGAFFRMLRPARRHRTHDPR